ncbi:hypothetical protein HMPREF0645_2471 [Hallella bergensis DSM 17361]|uniref:Uncharacterized protein n=1 Tax=Hallella bergensis DSM 17361 TaxID=585502 RepID=D1PZT6_9BACT|nr:hypothetical protein [Hallella bergensis]EFA43118.1 hypothetical protein HMPREF0645_2471 [Hallella bergensis DSM 17361]
MKREERKGKNEEGREKRETTSASLRSIEAQLTAFNSKLYHAGLKIIPKSTLANMNEKKDWRIYQDYAMIPVDKAKDLYKDMSILIGCSESFNSNMHTLLPEQRII